MKTPFSTYIWVYVWIGRQCTNFVRFMYLE